MDVPQSTKLCTCSTAAVKESISKIRECRPGRLFFLPVNWSSPYGHICNLSKAWTEEDKDGCLGEAAAVAAAVAEMSRMNCTCLGLPTSYSYLEAESRIDAYHWHNQNLEKERHTVASLDFLFYEVVETLVIPDISSCLKSIVVVALHLVWKTLEGLMEEETDP